jgi:Fe2+ or Zn2+ uptake regulation protein
MVLQTRGTARGPSRMTPARRLIIDVISSAREPQDRFALLRACLERSPELRTDTLYRVLRELTNAGIVAREKAQGARSKWARNPHND